MKRGGYCKECQLDMQALEKCGFEKAAVYELLRAGMVGRPAQVLRCHEKDITRIKSHEGKLTKGAIGYDANNLYLYCSGDVMPCDKAALAVNKKPFDQKKCKIFKGRFKKETFLGFHKSTLKCLTNFMTISVRWHRGLLFKRFLIVMCLKN